MDIGGSVLRVSHFAYSSFLGNSHCSWYIDYNAKKIVMLDVICWIRDVVYDFLLHLMLLGGIWDLLHNSYVKGGLAVGALLGPGRGLLLFKLLVRIYDSYQLMHNKFSN